MIEELKGCFPWSERVPRSGQLEVVSEIIEAFDSNDYVLLNGPTGSGKSVIAITLARYFNNRQKHAYLLTTEKILQKQYNDDFSSLHNVSYLLGANNYSCDLNNEPYEDGICHMMDYNDARQLQCFESCTYRSARSLAKISPIVISNYHYMILDQDYLSEEVRMPHKYLGVYDEAHNLEKILRDYTKVELSDESIDSLESRFRRASEYGKIRLPEISELRKIKSILDSMNEENNYGAKSRFTQVKNFYNSAIEILRNYAESQTLSLYEWNKGSAKADSLRTKSIKYCFSLCRDLEKTRCKISNMEKTFTDTIWIFEKNEKDGSVFMKPVYARYLFKASLDQMTDKKLFMSATLAGKKSFSDSIGIDPDRVKEIHIPSDFPAENRPVRYWFINNDFTMSAGRQNIDRCLPELVFALDELISAFREDKMGKILIHSGTYRITKYVLDNSVHSRRMLAPKPETRDELIDEFKRSKDGILISPSLNEGLSLDDDLCRVQIVLKVPYLNLEDKAIRTRLKQPGGNEWYRSQAINVLIQGCGRSVRHKEDYCETYVLDPAFPKLVRENPDLFPKYFLDAVTDC